VNYPDYLDYMILYDMMKKEFFISLINKFFNYILFYYLIIYLLNKNIKEFKDNGDWGLGIGDWGLGIGPNPQSPIPNPQSPFIYKRNS